MSGSDNGKAPLTKGAKPRPRPRRPAPRKMKPVRIEGVLVAAVLDDDGEVVDELPVAEIKLYAPKFGTLPDVVEGVWPGVLEKHSQS